MNIGASTVLLTLSAALALIGFLLPFWPLALLGVAIAALAGRWVFAVVLGILLDAAYGAPTGAWHVLYAPFTIFALILSGARYYWSGYIREGNYDRL